MKTPEDWAGICWYEWMPTDLHEKHRESISCLERLVREVRCENTADLRDLLCEVAQLLDGWHNDGTAWSAWDESVRKRVSAMQKTLEKPA
jgi:hypothetical protein